MKVIQVYPSDALKLWHRKPGDVVRICKNDVSVPDNDLYIVTDNETFVNLVNLVNLVTGEIRSYHTSSRCIHYKKAAVYLNGTTEGEDE